MQTMINGKPLEFGNIEQIAHINTLKAKEREKAERERRLSAGELVEFEVKLKVEGAIFVTVEASSKAEAEKLAKSDLDVFDIDIEDVYVEECRAV